MFAHCLHLDEQEWDCLCETRSAIAFCPTSNLFLGSGLFDLKQAWRKRVKLGIGTDVGAGTTFNMLRTLGEAYKVGQLQQLRYANSATTAEQGFVLMTLGDDRNIYRTYVDGKVVYEAPR